MRRDPKTTVQCVHCRRRTTCVRHYFTTRFTESLTDFSPLTARHTRLLDQISGEWGIYHHVGRNDRPCKAFDTIHHDMIWRTLSISDISKPDVSLLKELYSNQRARVWTDTESDEIKIGTGSKQRDPWSSLKLKSVLPVALEDDLKTWREKGMGIKLGDAQSHCISNWRFADDVLWLFSSLNQLKKVMSDFKKEYK